MIGKLRVLVERIKLNVKLFNQYKHLMEPGDYRLHFDLTTFYKDDAKTRDYINMNFNNTFRFLMIRKILAKLFVFKNSSTDHQVSDGYSIMYCSSSQEKMIVIISLDGKLVHKLFRTQAGLLDSVNLITNASNYFNVPRIVEIDDFSFVEELIDNQSNENFESIDYLRVLNDYLGYAERVYK